MSGPAADSVRAGIPARVARLGEQLAERELDALLVEERADLRYVSGYTGTNGLALLRPAGGPPPRFLTDFRYTEQSAQEVPSVFERATVTGELRDTLPGLLGDGGGRLGFDATKLTVRGHERLGELLGERWQLVPADGLVTGQRAVKEDGEVAAIAAACELADAALRELLEGGLAGRTEREVAFELETGMRRLGAEQPSFPSIVAAGPHGALPHAQPRDAEIPRDVLVTIDWGAQLDGYCSDCTRTYATGEGISDRQREAYASVLEAQLAGLAAVRPGTSGRDADAKAREVLERAGLGERFGHGLGHGVGLEVHEGPRLSRTEADALLAPGNVVTVEPGVYLPGEFGVRIEDLVAVGEQDNSIFTSISKELTVIE